MILNCSRAFCCCPELIAGERFVNENLTNNRLFMRRFAGRFELFRELKRGKMHGEISYDRVSFSDSCLVDYSRNQMVVFAMFSSIELRFVSY